MRVLKYILVSLLTAALLVGLGFLMYFSHKDRALLACNKLEVSFTDSLRFVSEENVRDYLAANYGSYIGQRLDSVGLSRIENLLERRSAIMDCEAWMTDDGVLHLSLSQRAPVLRFEYEDGSGGYYIDEGGFIFPLHPTYTAPVPVIRGNIIVRPKSSYKGYAMEKDKAWIEAMLALHFFIEGSKQRKALVKDLRIGARGEVLLRSSRGEEEFVLGEVRRLDEKFGEILKYYDYIVPNMGAGYYKQVDLRYKQQIICRKDI